MRAGTIPDSKVRGDNMGPTWVLSAPDGPHVGHMNLVIRDMLYVLPNWLAYSRLPDIKWKWNPDIANFTFYHFVSIQIQFYATAHPFHPIAHVWIGVCRLARRDQFAAANWRIQNS